MPCPGPSREVVWPEDGDGARKIPPSAPALHGHSKTCASPSELRAPSTVHQAKGQASSSLPSVLTQQPLGAGVWLSPDTCPPSTPLFYAPGDLGDFLSFPPSPQSMVPAPVKGLCSCSSFRSTRPPPLRPYSAADCPCSVLMCNLGLCTGKLLTKMPSCPPLTRPTRLPRPRQVPHPRGPSPFHLHAPLYPK